MTALRRVLPLAPQFIAAATERLRALAERHGYRLAASDEDWQAEVVLTRSDSSIRLTYGDRELTGNALVARRGGAAEYSLWEWLDALDVAEAPATYVDWLQTPERLADWLDAVVQVLEQHVAGILAAGPSVLTQLEANRTARRAYERDLMARRELDSLTARAAQAFWARRYEQVIELLQPFADRLGPADARKLAYSKRHSSADG